MNPVDIGIIVSNVNYLDWQFQWEPMGDGVLIWARFMSYEAPDAIHLAEQETRKWYIPCDAGESEVVRTCLLLVLTAEEHEAREWFSYRGKTVYSPHQSVMEKVALT